MDRPARRGHIPVRAGRVHLPPRKDGLGRCFQRKRDRTYFVGAEATLAPFSFLRGCAVAFMSSG
jgi:hypothetical protein